MISIEDAHTHTLHFFCYRWLYFTFYLFYKVQDGFVRLDGMHTFIFPFEGNYKRIYNNGVFLLINICFGLLGRGSKLERNM